LKPRARAIAYEADKIQALLSDYGRRVLYTMFKHTGTRDDLPGRFMVPMGL